jgi:hypothetical protein
MKMLGTFWAGAVAGFLLGSTKQGCNVRRDLENAVKGLIGGESKGDESKPENNKQDADFDALYDQDEAAAEADDAADADGSSTASDNSDLASTPVAQSGGLDIKKATELAERLGAKVSEPQGEEALPHSHQLDIAPHRLSA